jgi:hypothetical protein
MNYYLSAQDFITENKDRSVNVIMYITHRITPKMRLKYSEIQKDDKYYFMKNDETTYFQYRCILNNKPNKIDFIYEKNNLINKISHKKIFLLCFGRG